VRIGTIFLGNIEYIEGEHITTKFLIIGLPIIPLSSFYAKSAHFSGINGFEIPLHPTSVALGYARATLFALTLVIGGFAYFENQPHLYVLAGATLILWFVSLFFLGTLSAQEKLKRTVLKSHTGLYADPVDLPSGLRISIYASLKKDWEPLAAEKNWLLDKHPWEQCMVSVSLDLQYYTLAYTMARYARNVEATDLVWAMASLKLDQLSHDSA
jgi:hypothetical protein